MARPIKQKKLHYRTSQNLKTVIDSFIDEVAKIIVLNGTGPDTTALALLQTELALLLK